MRVRVKLSWPISKTVGARTVDLEVDGDPSITDALARLGADHPDFARELASGAGGGTVPYAIFLNGSQIPREEMGRLPLRDGDELYIILPITGGDGKSKAGS